jgi:hypothetical protein
MSLKVLQCYKLKDEWRGKRKEGIMQEPTSSQHSETYVTYLGNASSIEVFSVFSIILLIVLSLLILFSEREAKDRLQSNMGEEGKMGTA